MKQTLRNLSSSVGQIVQPHRPIKKRKLEPMEVNTASTPPRAPRAPDWNKHGEPRCFNCDRYGHFARLCPHPKRHASGNDHGRISQA